MIGFCYRVLFINNELNKRLFFFRSEEERYHLSTNQVFPSAILFLLVFLFFFLFGSFLAHHLGSAGRYAKSPGRHGGATTDGFYWVLPGFTAFFFTGPKISSCKIPCRTKKNQQSPLITRTMVTIEKLSDGVQSTTAFINSTGDKKENGRRGKRKNK